MSPASWFLLGLVVGIVGTVLMVLTAGGKAQREPVCGKCGGTGRYRPAYAQTYKACECQGSDPEPHKHQTKVRFLEGNKLQCYLCSLDDDLITDDPERMLNHLNAHVAMGDHVEPKYLLAVSAKRV